MAAHEAQHEKGRQGHRPRAVALYAKRQASRGFAFSPDSYMQHELEASFIYEDTPDQQTATQLVKQDMESPVPMDRLVCGDVGFGKTEIAIRAAFKAVTDSKQVAVLVPTTILALQHYRTFNERLKEFPVRIEHLSRLKSAKETRQILEEVKSGKIDILSARTRYWQGHRVQGPRLLVSDEEQKFGVAAKEKLRQLRAEIDTLTLTATPIPRTLQFSLMGSARPVRHHDSPAQPPAHSDRDAPVRRGDHPRGDRVRARRAADRYISFITGSERSPTSRRSFAGSVRRRGRP